MEEMAFLILIAIVICSCRVNGYMQEVADGQHYAQGQMTASDLANYCQYKPNPQQCTTNYGYAVKASEQVKRGGK
jgi:hypothetical protein